MQHADVDTVVVGSGAAGLMAAAVVAQSHSVVLLTDRGLGTSNSAVAQGGLQYPDGTVDAVAAFRNDMLVSGGETVDVDRLDHFVQNVRTVVDLMQKWGLELDRDEEGRLRKLSAGGLSEPRVVTSGDRIGPQILAVLRRRVLGTTIDVRTRAKVTAIESADRGLRVTATAGTWIARTVVVATGGRSFEHAGELGLPTSNPRNSNGDMHVVLRSLGLAEIEPDLFQFHPYGIVDADGVARGRCVPESITSMGAYVADRNRKQLVEPQADRLAVADAIRRCMARGDGISVGNEAACLLVLDDVADREIAERYPHLVRSLDGRRLASGDVPIRPVVHYQLGGFVVGADGSTSVPGLFLAGEITGGLHGRNRLMGNGITEAVVDGWAAASSASTQLASSALN